MCTSKAPRACPAASQPTAQRCAAPVGVPTASAMPAPARECAEACLLAQTLLEPATPRARAGCDAKKPATRCPACTRGSQAPPALSPAPCNPTPPGARRAQARLRTNSQAKQRKYTRKATQSHAKATQSHVKPMQTHARSTNQTNTYSAPKCINVRPPSLVSCEILKKLTIFSAKRATPLIDRDATVTRRRTIHNTI